ncbi:MAG: hypothetical protein LBP62_00420 [Clostridiales bacterium]|nr:hypothetical protein [Clostridiales bacterium]
MEFSKRSPHPCTPPTEGNLRIIRNGRPTPTPLPRRGISSYPRFKRKKFTFSKTDAPPPNPSHGGELFRSIHSC